jgi:DNA-binding response OmpR family regulator
MKVLYSVKDLKSINDVVEALSNMPDWDVTPSDGKENTLNLCSTGYYDVLVIDSTIEESKWLETIKEIRNRQIFTPILVIVSDSHPNSMISGLIEGADMCIPMPIAMQEMILRIRVLKRRNTNYQSPLISFRGIDLNRPDGKICYGETSLSVTPIEIEVFRLLTRASTAINIKTLAEKIGEEEEKVVFFAKCLKKKIGLLGSPIQLKICGSQYQLISET